MPNTHWPYLEIEQLLSFFLVFFCSHQHNCTTSHKLWAVHIDLIHKSIIHASIIHFTKIRIFCRMMIVIFSGAHNLHIDLIVIHWSHTLMANVKAMILIALLDLLRIYLRWAVKHYGNNEYKYECLEWIHIYHEQTDLFIHKGKFAASMGSFGARACVCVVSISTDDRGSQNALSKQIGICINAWIWCFCDMNRVKIDHQIRKYPPFLSILHILMEFCCLKKCLLFALFSYNFCFSVCGLIYVNGHLNSFLCSYTDTK